MRTYDCLLLAGSICGITMVLGGIFLLYKGAISLKDFSEEGAISLEFKRELRITTQYPALAIFLIGLLFVIFPTWMGKSEVIKLKVQAESVNTLEPVTVSLRANSWTSDFVHSGRILDTFYPNIDIVQITVSAPGYKPFVHTQAINHSREEFIANLGKVHLEQKLSTEDIAQNSIIEPSEALGLDPVTSNSKFGYAQ